MATKTILKDLYADLVKGMDPDSVPIFVAKGLLTNGEKEKIDAAPTRTKKNTSLVDALRRRDATKAIEVIIEALEGEDGEEKEANSILLKKIAESQSFYFMLQCINISSSFLEYPPYSFEGDHELSTDNPPPTAAAVPTPPIVQVTVPPLPRVDQPMKLVPRGSSGTSSDPVVAKISMKSAHDEGTDGVTRDRYAMSSVPRGYCIIINNIKFSTLKERSGSNWDADSLEELFGRYLGFHVERYDDLDSHRIVQLMKTVQQQDHSALSCLVVAILSHGVNGQVYGTDGQLIKVDTLTDHFTGRWCPSLNGKPKIFLLQACRGGSFDYGAIEGTDDGQIDESAVLDEDEFDGGGYTLLPDNADFVLAYATTPGFVSWRNSGFGTWFIKAFVDTMYEKAATDHLMDNLVEVNRKVAEEYESRGKQKQMPAPVTTLRYKLFLTPVKTK